MKFILGLDSRQEGDGRPMSVSKFGELWRQGLLGMGLRLLLEKKSWLLPAKQYEKVCSKLHSFVDFAIGRSHERMAMGQQSDKKSMVDVLVTQTDDEDARSQLMHTMLANQDTTSVLTCNMIQLLSDRPDIWEQLRNEVRAKGPELLTFDGLRDSQLIHKIQMETLRLRPVFPILGRRTLRSTILPTGGGPNGDQPLPLPVGTSGLVNFWSLNRNPDVFGPDVDSFNPERWDSIKPKPNEFVPFGLGPRACLGKEKALAESAYLLIKLAGKFAKLERRVREWRPRSTISMINLAGYKVAFTVGEV
jgi:cytochrome P450